MTSFESPFFPSQMAKSCALVLSTVSVAVDAEPAYDPVVSPLLNVIVTSEPTDTDGAEKAVVLALMVLGDHLTVSVSTWVAGGEASLVQLFVV